MVVHQIEGLQVVRGLYLGDLSLDFNDNRDVVRNSSVIRSEWTIVMSGELFYSCGSQLFDLLALFLWH